MERTDKAYSEWLATHMPQFFKEATDDESRIVAHTLVYNEEYEEYVFLKFKTTAIVVSLDRPMADLEILRHYGDYSVKEYYSYVSDENLPGYSMKLRITRVGFVGAPDAADKVMPADVKNALLPEALVKDHVQHKFIPKGQGQIDLCFAWRNVPKRFFLYRLALMCQRHDVKIQSLRFAFHEPLSDKCILLGNITLEGQIVSDDLKLRGFLREFELLKNLKYDCLTELVNNSTITGNNANLLRAIGGLAEQILTDVNPALYTKENCLEAFAFHPELTVKFLNVFSAKFNPSSHNFETYKQLHAELEKALADLDTGRKKHDDRRRNVFLQALNITKHTLRTNAYNFHKLGIGFRLDPHFMDNVPGFDRKTKFPELPFSIFYIKGWNYLGFQIRFRDLSRGGMRTVIARDQEHAKFERANMLTECYNLAYTQQKKNKDIPEGGSKAILFLSPNEELPFEKDIVRKELQDAGTPEEKIKEMLDDWAKKQELEYLYYNQRCFLNTFLCLFIWDFDKNCLKYGDYIVDYLKVPEYIYLGPDENMHDSQIEWLAKESTRLGYYAKGAFISGKEVGINHKEFGVTSWGVFQYLKQTLKYLQLEDKEWSCKITGGPDGDVAGNIMRLIAEDPKMGSKAKLKVVTDASGTIYDPVGLNWPVLVKMFHECKPIHEYPLDLLHDGSFLVKMWQTRQKTSFQKEYMRIKKESGKVIEEWISGNQAFHIFRMNAHEKYADIFIPCGGRPRTLQASNINDFFDKNGKPTCLAQLEGANLYITQDAREILEDKGVMVFKDSSANKCGVVSSSYEILAGLILTDEQFKAIKPELVKNVLARLEKVANDEAVAMIDYWVKNNKKIKLTHISELVSQRINKFTDDIAEYLKPLDLKAPENKKLLDVFVNYVPECIKKGHLETCLARVPEMHKKAVIATSIATRLVYEKGLDWQPSVVDILPILLA